jgi:hypothetical protein
MHTTHQNRLHAGYIGLSNADDPDGADCGRDRAEQRERSAASASVSPRMHTTHQDDSTQCIYEARVRVWWVMPRLATIQSRSSWSRLCWRIERPAESASVSPRIHTTHQDDSTQCIYEARVRTIQSRWCWFRHRLVKRWRSTESASIHACTPRVYTLLPNAVYKERSTKSVLTQGDESPCVSGRSTESASIHACTPRVYTLSQSAAARQSPRWTSLRGVVRVRYIKQSRSPC